MGQNGEPRLPSFGKDSEGRWDKLLSECAECGKVLSVMNRCSGCQCRTYCNRDCQRAHWKQHKGDCKRLAAANYVQVSRLADAGDEQAIFAAAAMLLRGHGVAKRPAEALAMLRRSEAAGCRDASNQIGHLLANGDDGVAKDLPASARAFLRASEAGCANSAYCYGRACAYGTGVALDSAAALRWLQAAVDLSTSIGGNDIVASAYYEMGRLRIGGTSEDSHEAERCYRAGAAAGSGECAQVLAVLFASGGDGFPGTHWRRSTKEAKIWARRAIELGCDSDEMSELMAAALS